MSWITNILSGGTVNLIKQIGGIADKFHLSGEEKQQFTLDMETLLQKRDSETEETIRTRLGAKERVLVAELQQGDKFTKRARPSVVYAGLILVFLNYCLLPAVFRLSGVNAEPLPVPKEFWIGWSGIVATWCISRTVERRGVQNTFIQKIAGNMKSSLL